MFIKYQNNTSASLSGYRKQTNKATFSRTKTRPAVLWRIQTSKHGNAVLKNLKFDVLKAVFEELINGRMFVRRGMNQWRCRMCVFRESAIALWIYRELNFVVHSDCMQRCTHTTHAWSEIWCKLNRINLFDYSLRKNVIENCDSRIFFHYQLFLFSIDCKRNNSKSF